MKLCMGMEIRLQADKTKCVEISISHPEKDGPVGLSDVTNRITVLLYP